MSYNGTVRCGWCYQSGHNKRSCPEYTELLKQRALQEINSGEGYEGYWGKMYNKRVRATGLYADGTEMPAEVKKAQKQVRRCKYCNKQGHNRRTCPTLKADKQAWVEREVEFRKELAQNMRAHGVGVGTLLKSERWGETYGWMIRGVRWDHIVSHAKSNGSFIEVERLRSQGVSAYSRRDHQALPKMGDFNSDSWNNTEVLAPVAAQMVVIPENFTKPESLEELCKDHFAEARSSCWYDNY